MLRHRVWVPPPLPGLQAPSTASVSCGRPLGRSQGVLLIRLGPQPGAWSTGSSDTHLSNSDLSPFLLSQLALSQGSRGGGSPWRRELGVQAGWRAGGRAAGSGSRLDETARCCVSTSTREESYLGRWSESVQHLTHSHLNDSKPRLQNRHNLPGRRHANCTPEKGRTAANSFCAGRRPVGFCL